jgi:hypothetical protein
VQMVDLGVLVQCRRYVGCEDQEAVYRMQVHGVFKIGNMWNLGTSPRVAWTPLSMMFSGVAGMSSRFERFESAPEASRLG